LLLVTELWAWWVDQYNEWTKKRELGS
jgi:hypothetical protein